MLKILSEFLQKRKVSKDLKKRQKEYDKQLQMYNNDIRSADDSCQGLKGNHLEVMRDCASSSRRHRDYFLANNKRPTE